MCTGINGERVNRGKVSRRQARPSPPATAWRRGGITALGLLLAFGSWATGVASQTLVTFDEHFDQKTVHGSDAKATVLESAAGYALRVETGHEQPWPGITLPATSGHWDLSSDAAVWVRLQNTGTNAVTVYCRVDNPGADGSKHCVTGSVELAPGQTNTLKVPLPHAADDTLAGRLFGMRGYVLGALRHPQWVGTHWFQWQDEPTTGRVYDEENYQIGFVDIADTPYRETIAASRAIGQMLYPVRADQK